MDLESHDKRDPLSNPKSHDTSDPSTNLKSKRPSEYPKSQGIEDCIADLQFLSVEDPSANLKSQCCKEFPVHDYREELQMNVDEDE